MNGEPLKGVEVYVRQQDLTPEIIELCKLTKPKQNGRGIQMPIPLSQEELNKGNYLGWAMITGVN